MIGQSECSKFYYCYDNRTILIATGIYLFLIYLSLENGATKEAMKFCFEVGADLNMKLWKDKT